MPANAIVTQAAKGKAAKKKGATKKPAGSKIPKAPRKSKAEQLEQMAEPHLLPSDDDEPDKDRTDT